MFRTIYPIIAIIAIAVSGSVALADGTISLRREVTLPSGAIHLADIADLQGAEALALADITIVSGVPRSGTRITLEEVSQILSTARNINLGKLTFHGSACIVSLPAPKPAAQPQPAPVPVPVASQGPLVRDLIPRRISQLLGVEPEKLRLTFEDTDRKLLDQPTTGRVVELKPVGAADRMPLQLSIYEDRKELGHTLIASGTIRVGVNVLREVVTAKTILRKGEPITIDSIGTDQQWLGIASKPALIDNAIGAIVRTSKINPGQALMENDVEQAIAIKRGQLCSVHVVSSSFVLKTQARALDAGKVGDTIKFTSAASKDKKDVRTFEARIEGPGRAIMTVTGAAALN